MNSKSTVTDYLLKLGIDFEQYDHDAAFTIEECERIKKAKGWELCKNLLLKNSNGSQFWLLLMKSDKSFVTSQVSKKLESSRLSFAPGEEMLKKLQTPPGSLSILSLIFDKEKEVRLAVDRQLLEDEYFYCHPCDNTSSLKIKTSDITEKFLPSLGIEAKITEI